MAARTPSFSPRNRSGTRIARLGVGRELLRAGRASSCSSTRSGRPRVSTSPASEPSTGSRGSGSLPGALPLTAASSPPSGRYTTSVRAPTMPRPWSTISASTRSSSVSPPTARAISANASRRSTLRARPRMLPSSWSAYRVRSRCALLTLGDVAAQPIREPADDDAGHDTSRPRARCIRARATWTVLITLQAGTSANPTVAPITPAAHAELDRQQRDRDHVEVRQQRVGVVDDDARGKCGREQQTGGDRRRSRGATSIGPTSSGFSRSTTRRSAASSSSCRARAVVLTGE